MDEITTLKYKLQKLKMEFASMLERAAAEHQNLQIQVNRLLPLARAFEALDTVLSMGRANPSYTEDFAQKLSRRADELRQEVNDANIQASETPTE